jgi:hypothetical protein
MCHSSKIQVASTFHFTSLSFPFWPIDAHARGNISKAIKIMAEKKVVERWCFLTDGVVFMAFPSFLIEAGCKVLSHHY